MTAPTVIPPGGGEVVGDAPDRRVEILSDHDGLHATWSRFGAHREGADLHVHRHHTDLFYVLEGELTIRLGVEDEPVVVPAGTLARVPPLVVHGFRNGSDADVRYLNFHAPGQGFTDFMRALRDGRPAAYDQHPPPPDGGRPTSEAVIGGAEVVVERPGLRMTVLADVDEIGITETWSEGGAPPAEASPDRRSIASFYVLEGELAGTWVQLPPGAPHTLPLAGSEPVRFLSVHSVTSGP
jgi:mannose-6-phosphate isomerase-like protein (cupin superfamily)